MERERSLDPDAEGLLVDREGLCEPRALALDADPSKTWIRWRFPSITLEWTRSVSPALNRGVRAQIALLEALDRRVHREEAREAGAAQWYRNEIRSCRGVGEVGKGAAAKRPPLGIFARPENPRERIWPCQILLSETRFGSVAAGHEDRPDEVLLGDENLKRASHTTGRGCRP